MGRLVPRDAAAVELLGDDITVLGLIALGRTQIPPGGTAEFVPRRVHGTTDDHGAEVGSPEDDGLVRGGERHEPAGRGGQPAVGFAGGREAEIAGGPPTLSYLAST